MAKINKTYKPGDEFTPDSVNEIITAVNKNTDDISNMTMYSLEETVIGTWVNNKPIYQKVIIFNNSATSHPFDLSSLNIDSFIDISGIFSGGSIITSINFKDNDNEARVIYNATNKIITVTTTIAGTAILIIKYTKQG